MGHQSSAERFLAVWVFRSDDLEIGGTDFDVDLVFVLLGQALVGAPEESFGIIGADSSPRIQDDVDFGLELRGQGNRSKGQRVVNVLRFGEPASWLQHTPLEANVSLLRNRTEADCLDEELALLNMASSVQSCAVVLDLESEGLESDNCRGSIERLVMLCHIHAVLRICVGGSSA